VAPLPHPQDRRGRLQQRLPGGRELDPARGAVEQRGAQVGLERPDGTAEVGLGQMHALGRAAEVKLLGHYAEDLELAMVHDGILSISETIVAVLVLDTPQHAPKNREA
jgi:hypothetical protein